MPGKQVCPDCLGMSCLRAEVDHALGDFLCCQTWDTGNLYISPEPGKSRCFIYKEISVRCV